MMHSQDSGPLMGDLGPPPPPPVLGSQQQQKQLHQRQRHATTSTTTTTPITPGVGSSLRGSPTASAYPSYNYSLSGQQQQQQQRGSSSWAAPSTSLAYSPTSPLQKSSSSEDQSSSSSTSSSLLSRTPVYFLIPTVLSLLFLLVDSMLPLQVAMVSSLIVYGLDLSNAPRPLFLYSLVLQVVLLSVSQLYACLLEQQQQQLTLWTAWMAPLLQTLVAALVWTTVAAALALSSVEWLVVKSNTNDTNRSTTTSPTATARRLQSLVHGLVPPLFAGLGTSAILASEESGGGDGDGMALLAPHAFALLLALAMLAMARTAISNAANDSSSSSGQTPPPSAGVVVGKQVAQCHTALLLLTPMAMHLCSFASRIVTSFMTLDDVFSLVLVATVPLLLYEAVCALQFVNNNNNNNTTTINTKLAMYTKLVPIWIVAMVAVMASVALHQRYLLAMSHSFSYRFFGTKTGVWSSTAYWFVATAALLFSLSLWGKTTTISQDEGGGALMEQPLLGEYQEDAVQLGLALAGMCLGKAFGLPWNFVPLPVLAILGLVLWMTTRMLRYLAIFLFVGHATGVVVFTYRFAGMEQHIRIANIVQLSLMKFAFVVVATSVLVGLIAGLSVRSSGGVGAKLMRKLDVTGTLLILYAVLLIALEVTLLKRPETNMEHEELQATAGAGVGGVALENNNTLYHPSLAMLTSLLLVGLSSFLKRVNVISSRSSAVVSALAIGKAVSIYIDAHQQHLQQQVDDSGFGVFLRSLVAALLALVMFAPRAFLEPVHVKTFSRRSSKTSGRRGGDIPPGAMKAAFWYAFCFLPMALLVAVPFVLVPLAGVFANQFQDDYYSSAAATMMPGSNRWPIPELVGVSVALWGLACLSMLNHYLPDAGGEAWKKLSALAFLVGTGIFFAAPILGISNAAVTAASKNPYAAMSSLGSQLIRRRRSRTGGWGLLAAAIATLLAISGPLELKERPATRSGHRDKLLLFRTMMFGLLFGGGVAWFMVMQTMREADLIELVIVSIACLIIASMGTVAAVLGYFLTLEEFEDVVLVTRVWIVVLVIFLPFAWSSRMFVSESLHLFGPGGWLSTYLSVSSLAALAMAVTLRIRSTKNVTTSSLGNLLCVLSWTCANALLFGRYGVAGLDANYDVRTLFWIPASVVGTLLVSPILLALEGEASSRRQSAVRKLASAQRPSSGTAAFGFHLAQLRQSNRWVPLFFGSVLVLLLASLYAIFLRGSGILSASVSKSHEEVHNNIFATNLENPMPDLATLAAKAISQSNALVASAKLAGTGFWTAKSIFGPLLHLGGVIATLPSLYLLLQRSWYGTLVPTAKVTLALPLNAIPLVLCRGLPSLQAVAVMGLLGGVTQLMTLRRADQEQMMRI